MVGIAQQRAVKRPSAKPANLKAVFMYSFFMFARWPEDLGTSFHVGIVGPTPVTASLEKVAESRRVNGRAIVVKSLSIDDEALGDCHMVFLSDQLQLSDFQSILRRIGDRPIITVSDHPDFHDAGGLLTFVQVDQNIRFRYNPLAAKKTNVTFDAKLLRLRYTQPEASESLPVTKSGP